ncbi:MAG: rRNA maturation RNase YbeY [Bacteroidales bacterium]|jgi:rRNA maturation RNase YbeY|nr:rRNA maturation RNase YbeY [Bacteroidales bacterium]
MINFQYHTNFNIEQERLFKKNLKSLILDKGLVPGEITYVFCDDEYLSEVNMKYLNHDTLTDIITFDNRVGERLNGEIYISIDRVKENAQSFEVAFEEELIRVVAHGILHLCGYKDKTEEEAAIMRQEEEKAIRRFLIKTGEKEKGDIL